MSKSAGTRRAEGFWDRSNGTLSHKRQGSKLTFAEAYARFVEKVGQCPIEAGTVGSLADHECVHGRLPTDPTPACGCWVNESTNGATNGSH